MSNRRNIQFHYSPHNKATVLDCSFVVDQTNGNGLGIRSLKASGRIASVYMNTSPAATTSSSVFASGVSTITLSRNINSLVVGMVVTDSTTSGNITGGTTITAINTITSQITLSAPTAGASASSPGDTLSFAMTAALAGNPNPQSGIIVVNLQDNYNTYLGGYAGFSTVLTGSALTSFTVGHVYVITSLGTSTQANWVAAGLSPSVQAAVGVSFVAAATSVTGSGTAKAFTTSGIDHIELVGDPNLMNSIGAQIAGSGTGMQIISACYSAGTLTAPANGTVIGMNFYLNDSAQGV